MTNQIKECRQKKGLTQKQLASMVGTTQQSIQRLESDNQAPRFDVAIALCKALEMPLQDVFPDAKGATQNITRLFAAKSSADGKKAEKALEEVGFEMDLGFWAVTLICGQLSFDLEVSGRESTRIWDLLQTSDEDSFLVVDTDEARFAVSRSEIQLWQFTFDPPYPSSPEDGSSTGSGEDNLVRIWLKNRGEPLEFSVEEDEFVSQDDQDDGQMSHIFCMLDGAGRRQLGPLMFKDANGEPVFFDAKQVVAISCPLSVLDPAEYDE